MVNAIRILSLLVVVQLAVVAVFYWPASGTSGEASGGSFLDVASGAVVGLELEGPDGSVRLEKTEQGWRIPALNELPASQDSVSKLLEGLRNARPGLAVARSEDAAQRFRVAGDDFERRLTVSLADQDRKPVLFFGDTPGAGEIYARRKGEDSVFRVGVGTHMMPLEADQWLTKDLLSLDQQKVQSLTINDIRIERVQTEPDQDGGGEAPKPEWKAVSGVADDAELNPGAVSDLVSRVAALRISGAADDDQKVPEGEPTLGLRIGTEGDGSRQYRFHAGGKGEDALLVTDGYDTVFTVNTSVLDSLQKAAGVETLTTSSQSSGAGSDDGGDQSASDSGS
ncbi:DUF4340 domain-containing protein [Halomonadaceae bacterium KBTZ08]